MIISLKEFLKSGHFGSVTVGSTKGDVLNALGDNYTFYDLGETQVILYGWYEFFIWAQTLTVFGIQNDHLEADCLNHTEMINFDNPYWNLDTWFLKAGQNVTFQDVRNHLIREEIDFSEFSGNGSDRTIACIKSKVALEFCSEYKTPIVGNDLDFQGWTNFKANKKEEFVLIGMHLFDSRVSR